MRSISDIPWAAYGVHSVDVQVIDEGQAGRGDGCKRASERVSRDEQLTVLALLLDKSFDCVVDACRAVPHRANAIVEALNEIERERRFHKVKKLIETWSTDKHLTDMKTRECY